MGFVLALAALVIAIIEGATHGFSMIVLAIILLSVAVLLGAYETIGRIIPHR